MQLAELCSPQPLIGFNHQTGWRAVVMNVSNYDAKALRRHLRRAVAMIYRPKCAKRPRWGLVASHCVAYSSQPPHNS